MQNVEAAIHASSLMEAIISAIPAPVFYKDADGRYLGCNQAFAEFVGLEKEELIGKGVFELWNKDQAEVYHNADLALFKAGGEQNYEGRVTFADGTIRDVVFHKAVFFAEDEKISGMVGVMLDVTDRKELELSLKKSEELFTQAFRSNPGLLALTEPVSGKHYEVNDTWLNTLGFTRDEVIGKTAFELGIWPDLTEREKLLELLSVQRHVRDFDAKLKAKDGSIVSCKISNEVIATNDKDLVLWTANDITKRKKAEEASEAKSVFLSNMSHEFRTPLNAILGFVQMLQMNKERNLTDKQLRWLEQINLSGTLLLDLVNDVLDLARIESGRIEYVPETFKPREVFEECFNLMKPLSKEKNLTLQGIPETNRLLHVDRSILKQVLLNLINNAIKYNKQDGFIKFGCRNKPDDTLELYVEDNGLGISSDELPFVFEPFHRAKEHIHHADGTGVGLSIVKKNVELMNGTIEVTSTIGTGTCFTITLPAHKDKTKPKLLNFDI